MPPPPELESPFRWGTEEGLRDLIGGGVKSIESMRRTTRFYSRSVEDLAAEYRRDFGPTVTAFANLPEAKHEALLKDMVDVLRRYNRASDGTAIVEAKYVMAMAVRA